MKMKSVGAGTRKKQAKREEKDSDIKVQMKREEAGA